MDYEWIQEAAAYIRAHIQARPKVGLILGSGLGPIAWEIQQRQVLPYAQIPHFAASTAPGHRGQLVCGKLAGVEVVCMQGRFHHYEGHPMADIVFPVRVMRLLGVQTLIVTNAAGGINLSFQVGDLMLLEDHINFLGTNPLIGPNAEQFGPRFCDMTHAYTPRLRQIAGEAAEKLGIKLQRGVYLAATGPSFETPAEIRAFRVWGADAVGMSTVPEVITAAHCGMEVLAISLITNMAAGVLDQPLTEEEVIEIGEKKGAELRALIRQILMDLEN